MDQYVKIHVDKSHVDKIFIIMPSEDIIIMCEKLIYTKQDLVDFISGYAWQLFVKMCKGKCALKFWNRVIQSKVGPGKFFLADSINIPVYFPHAVTGDAAKKLRAVCYPLSEQKNSAVMGNVDMSKPAIYAGTMLLEVSPSEWDITRDISELTDPPTMCCLKLCITNLVFMKTEEPNLIDYYGVCHILNPVLFLNGVVGGPNPDEKLQKLSDAISSIAAKSHHTYTHELRDRLWFDLVQSRVGKNSFLLKMPFLIRMVSDKYKTDIVKRSSLLVLKSSDIENLYFPLDYHPDTRIGLFTSYLSMEVTSGIPSNDKELWRDIPLSLSDISQVGFTINILLTQLVLVSFADEEEIYAMEEGRKDAALSSNKFVEWWGNIHSYMQKFLNA